MKKTSPVMQYPLFVISLMSLLAALPTTPTRAAERPNIIVIMADDK